MKQGALFEAEQLLKKAVGDGMGSGAALGVVAPTGETWRCFVGRTTRWRCGPSGLVEDPRGASIQPATRFDLASLTKPMVTTTLVCQRIGAGQWRCDDLLREHLPEVAGVRPPEVTIGQLLSHSSGLPAWRDFYAETSAFSGSERVLEIQRRVARTALQRPPGQAAEYSDLGFMLLGWALQRSSGLRLDALFLRDVAQPWGLASARYRRLSEAPIAVALAADVPVIDVCATEIWPPRGDRELPLVGAVHDDNCAGLDGVAGHAGLFATLDDTLTWSAEWLCALSNHDRRLSSAAAAKVVAQTAATPTTWRGGFDTPSARGSNAGDTAPPETVGHLGFTGTSVWLAPGVGAIVLLTNRVHPSRADAAKIRALRGPLHDLCWRALAAD